jgi:capsular polysaccharide transport system permease protein
VLHGLVKQIQILRALMLRETRTRFGRHRLGYLWALIEPMTYVALFSGMYYVLGRTGPCGIPAVPFIATGILPYLMFQQTAAHSVMAISGNKGLLLYPQIRPLDLVLARVLLEALTSVVVFGLVMGGVALWEGVFRLDSVLTTLLGLLLASGLGASFGLLLCGLSTFSSAVEQLYGPLMRPLFWMSAIFFSTNQMPTVAQKFLLWNPVLHAVELTRDGCIRGYHVPQVNVAYPAAWIAVLFFLGLTVERVARRRLELT